MLKIWIGNKDDENIITARSFEAFFEDEWFDDPRVKQIIKDIDKSDATSFRQIESPFLGPISYRELSSGTLGLIMMMFVDDYDFSSLYFGDNCAKWILEISKTRDINFLMQHCFIFPDELGVEVVTDFGLLTTNGRDIMSEFNKRGD